MSSDPFIIVKEDVEQAIEQAGEMMEDWERLRRQIQSNRTASELDYLKDELFNIFNSVKQDLQDLQASIDKFFLNFLILLLKNGLSGGGGAKKDPKKFGLDMKEINSRQRFVSSVDQKIDNFKERISVFDSSKKVQPQPDTDDRNKHRMIIDFAAQQQQQQMIVEQQDEHMDSVLGTVRNLRGIANTMNTELDDQAVLLDEVDGMVDRTQSRLGSARNRVSDFLRRSQEHHPLKLILILILVILILIALIILT